VGVAVYGVDGDDADTLLHNAELALLRAKASGRGAWSFYDPSLDRTLQERRALAADLRTALDQGWLRLHYQPVYAGDGLTLRGYEALARWPHPTRGFVPPATFIPVAEDSGFIVHIGEWVLAQAVRQAALWYQRGYALPIAVNVSALQFKQPHFVDRVGSVLDISGLPPHLLELELTESILVHDADEALHRLHALARLGVKMSIDDFGTGYSSLSYLKRFPIGKLKIDRSFIKGLPKDEVDVGIVNAIVNLGRALHLDMVAEGIETEAQRAFMLKAGCAQYQGALFSPAVDALSLLTLLERNRTAARDIAEIKGWIETGP
jgi:EAL domain-containing protein (putative c-di-GMP-specific phosphodiesterase class I)